MLRFSFCRNSQWASRRLENWFQNSLKQLSVVQEKQVGLLLGVACADAAAHSWQGYTSAEISSWVQKHKQKRGVFSSEDKFESSSSVGSDYARGTLDPSRYQYGLFDSFSLREQGFKRRDMPEIPFSIHELHSSFSQARREGSFLSVSRKPVSSYPLAFASVSKGTTSPMHYHRSSNPDFDSRGMPSEDLMNLIEISHSFSYRFFRVAVEFMGRSKGNFFQCVSQLQTTWVHEAQLAVSSILHSCSGKCNATLFAQEHKTLLHSLFAVIGLPVLYPYTSDDALHQSSESLLNFLLDIEQGEGACLRMSDEIISILRRSCAWVVLSILMRCLQSNPDPLRNSAILVAERSLQAPFRPVEEIKGIYSFHFPFSGRDTGCTCSSDGEHEHQISYGPMGKETEKVYQSAPITEIQLLAAIQALFPDNIQKSCFGAIQESMKSDDQACLYNSGDPSLSAVHGEIQVIKEALTLASQFSTAASCAHPTDAFRRGIEAAIALGGDHKGAPPQGSSESSFCSSTESEFHSRPRWSVVTHRASLVGAFLGAKFGVKAIPLHWLSATIDHSVIASMGIDIAQFAWNPEPLDIQ